LYVPLLNSFLLVYKCFENHNIRGEQKMELRLGLAFVVMLAMALGHIKNGEKEKMRSLVQARAA
jgi:hypothetical protein